jgi:hypothetical protein
MHANTKSTKTGMPDKQHHPVVGGPVAVELIMQFSRRRGLVSAPYVSSRFAGPG